MAWHWEVIRYAEEIGIKAVKECSKSECPRYIARGRKPRRWVCIAAAEVRHAGVPTLIQAQGNGHWVSMLRRVWLAGSAFIGGRAEARRTESAGRAGDGVTMQGSGMIGRRMQAG